MVLEWGRLGGPFLFMLCGALDRGGAAKSSHSEVPVQVPAAPSARQQDER